MEIFLKLMNGKTIVIEVDHVHVSLLDVKRKVQDKEGIPPDQQRFLFRGKVIHEPWQKGNVTLSDYGIEKEDTIELQLRLRPEPEPEHKRKKLPRLLPTEPYLKGPAPNYRVAISHSPEEDPHWDAKGKNGPLWYATVDAPVLQTELGGFGNAFYGVRLQVQVSFFRDSPVLSAPKARLSPEFKGFLQRGGVPAVSERKEDSEAADVPQGDETAEKELALRPDDLPFIAPCVLEELEHARLGADIEAEWLEELRVMVATIGSLSFTSKLEATIPGRNLSRHAIGKLVDPIIHHAEHDEAPPLAPHNTTSDFKEAKRALREQRTRPFSCSTIFVKTLDGKTLQVPVPNWNLTVDDIKELLVERLDARPDEQLLVFAGQKMEPGDRTLEDYNVSRDSTLHCVVRKFSCRGCNFLGFGVNWNWMYSMKDKVDGMLAQQLHKNVWGLGIPEAERNFCPGCRYEALAELAALFPPLAHKDKAPIDPEALQWYLRCASPSPSTVWTPETDKYWPFVFRKVVRYCLQIRIPTAEHHGALTTIPHDVVSVIGSYL